MGEFSAAVSGRCFAVSRRSLPPQDLTYPATPSGRSDRDAPPLQRLASYVSRPYILLPSLLFCRHPYGSPEPLHRPMRAPVLFADARSTPSYPLASFVPRVNLKTPPPPPPQIVQHPPPFSFGSPKQALPLLSRTVLCDASVNCSIPPLHGSAAVSEFTTRGRPVATLPSCRLTPSARPPLLLSGSRGPRMPRSFFVCVQRGHPDPLSAVLSPLSRFYYFLVAPASAL